MLYASKILTSKVAKLMRQVTYSSWLVESSFFSFSMLDYCELAFTLFPKNLWRVAYDLQIDIKMTLCYQAYFKSN